MTAPLDTNPKTRFGQAKPGIHAIPPVALLHCGRAMEDGEEKYGLTNWREHEVSASVYYNAAFRHLASWWDGEEAAADSGVHHLGHVMACCAVLLDAQHTQKLNDNRPAIPGPFARAVQEMTRALAEGAAEAVADTKQFVNSFCPGPEDADCDHAGTPHVCLSSAPTGQQLADVKARAEANGGWGAAPDRVQSPEDADKGVAARLAEKMQGPEDVLCDRLDSDCEEIALRVLSTGNLEDAKDVIRGYLMGEWDKQPDPSEPRWCSEPCDECDPLPDGTIFVTVNPTISRDDLLDLGKTFLGEGHNRIAAFDKFRNHIGSHRVNCYDQTDRTRLAFYMETWAAGADVEPKEMDAALEACGFPVGE